MPELRCPQCSPPYCPPCEQALCPPDRPASNFRLPRGTILRLQSRWCGWPVFQVAAILWLALGFSGSGPLVVRGQDNVTTSNSQRPYGIDVRIPWTTSRIQGSPDPPLPYRTERLYTEISFEEPVAMTRAPGSNQPWVVERQGKIFQISADAGSDEKELVFDGAAQIPGLTAVYGLAFHPRFEQNRICFLCYILDQGLPDGTIVSRFRVTDSDPPRIDAASESQLLRWRSGGHNGGCLKFGPDGYLYISTGDGSAPSPPDLHDTGQDISDLLGSILRIDVDHRDQERRDHHRPYAIPADNPFVDVPGARPEVWAYGLRNPWRMTFDKTSGELWLGDVGWQLWEMVYRVQRGGNYGWSVMEGPQSVRPEATRGPTPILSPQAAHPRSDAASVTGGYVYRGTRFPDLAGNYVYGDYVTGKIWALPADESHVADRGASGQGARGGQGDRSGQPASRNSGHRLIADTSLMIITFYEDERGEILLLDYTSGTIHQLAVSERSVSRTKEPFPRKLSETGLFASVARHQPQAGVIPFSVNVQQWSDFATAQYLVAVPGTETMTLNEPQERVPTDWGEFPADTVLVKTLSLEMQRGNPRSRRRIETQILHFRGEAWRGNSGEWSGYSYIWNDEQTDATLAPRAGLNLEFTVDDQQAPGGRRQQTWHVSGQGECYQCHNPWTGYRLAFTVGQLNRDHQYGQIRDNQLRTLRHIDVLRTREGVSERAMVDPYDSRADLDDRARSYLHVNCAHCHRFGGGGTATIDLRFEVPLAETKMVGVRPTQGTFQIHRAQIVAPAAPHRSILYYRVAKLGPGRMPHIGSQYVDQRAAAMLAQWIYTLPDQTTTSAGSQPQSEFRQPQQARREYHQFLRRSVDALDRPRIEELLAKTEGALTLVQAIDAQLLPESEVDWIVNRSRTGVQGQVRDLFERFLPDDKRTRRLGSLVSPAQILSLRGDAERGRALFTDVAGVQCKTCHRIGEIGKSLGPDLTKIGARLNRVQLLESIIEPSKTIDPKYQTYLVETADGQVWTGLVTERTDETIVLQDAQNEVRTIARPDIEQLVPQTRSLMPELLYRDLTAQQLADLLSYLAERK